jgi:four helix bundle protein
MKNEKDSSGKTPRDICERTFSFAVRITKLCRMITRRAAPEDERLLARQLFRAGTSIGANTEEAQGSQSRADYASKMSIACKEARETRYWLRFLAATNAYLAKRLNAIIDESNQLIPILTTIVKKCRENVGK